MAIFELSYDILPLETIFSILINMKKLPDADLSCNDLVCRTAHHFPIRVYYEDTDALGIVYHANYFKFAERARTEMLRQYSIEQTALREATGLSFIVRRCTADFIQSARLDDDLVVVTRVASLGGASIEFHQEVQRAGNTLVRLNCQVACLGSNGRVHRLPPGLFAGFKFPFNSDYRVC